MTWGILVFWLSIALASIFGYLYKILSREKEKEHLIKKYDQLTYDLTYLGVNLITKVLFGVALFFLMMHFALII